jgi:hypothetical protein
MAVLTTDILITGVRRDDCFAWLSDPTNHASILANAFDQTTDTGDGHFELHLNTLGRKRVMGYRFIGPDDSHGGRRVRVETTGKRTRGTINYSLRTMKPSKNTLITLHLDYDPGGTLGGLWNAVALRASLESGMQTMLQNVDRSIPRNK